MSYLPPEKPDLKVQKLEQIAQEKRETEQFMVQLGTETSNSQENAAIAIFSAMNKMTRFEIKKEGQVRHFVREYLPPNCIRWLLMAGYTFGEPVFNFVGHFEGEGAMSWLMK